MSNFITYVALFCFSISCYAQSSTLPEVSQEKVVSKSVLQIIDQYFGNILENNVEITPLLGGNSSANFHIQIGTNQYVLRCNEKASSLRFQCELYAMEQAAKEGVSPIVFHSFPEDKMILMEYIDANTLTIEQANQLENCAKIANALCKAHAILKNPYHGIPRNEILEGFYKTLSDYPEIQTETTQAIKLIREGHIKIQDMPSSYSVNTHNDLNPGNIFLSNRGVLLIDWEGTNWEDPFYDLSYFAIFHDYDEKMEFHLMRNYLGREPSIEDIKRYKLTKIINFARISISCHFISVRSRKNDFDDSTPIKSWGFYVRALANKYYCNLSTSQFFYNLAKTALQQANTLHEQY